MWYVRTVYNADNVNYYKDRNDANRVCRTGQEIRKLINIVTMKMMKKNDFHEFYANLYTKYNDEKQLDNIFCRPEKLPILHSTVIKQLIL